MKTMTTKKYKTIDPGTLQKQEAYYLNTSLLVPRPIAWVATLGPDGVANCAPFSFFMGVSSYPPVLAFAVGKRRTGPKDTALNIDFLPEFTVNICNEQLGKQMVLTGHDFPHGVSEFDEAGLVAIASECVRPPRIGGAPVQMECVLHDRHEIKDTSTVVFYGRVVRYHLDPDVLDPATGLVDTRKLRPLGRLGGNQYCQVGDVIEITKELRSGG
jgi:flavin reductase (DIM6/NTAB) family NADH-FMN oxidoreductase RutF